MSTQTQASKQPVYGFTSDGEYLTPYQSTVIYCTNSFFESFVANLVDNVQLIPRSDILDHKYITDRCRYRSPDLIIFSGTVSQEDITKLIDYGFQQIKIFAQTDEEKHKYNYVCSDIHVATRVQLFDTSNIHEVVKFVPGLSTIYLLEYIICAQYSNYESVLSSKEINHKTGQYLVRALSFDKNPIANMLTLQDGLDSFDKISRAVVRGQTIYELYERLAIQRINAGIFYTNVYKMYAIYGVDVVEDLLKIVPICTDIIDAKTDYVVLYMIEPHVVDDKAYIGWRIYIITINSKLSIETTKTLVNEISTGDVTTNNGVVICWISSEKSKSILPFI